MLPSSTRLQKSVVAGILFTCALLYTSFRGPSPQVDGFSQQEMFGEEIGRPKPHDVPVVPIEVLQHVRNATLGFQEIYMISLQTRTDKRDSFVMQAALSSIEFTQIDGVDGQTVPAKARPHVS